MNPWKRATLTPLLRLGVVLIALTIASATSVFSALQLPQIATPLSESQVLSNGVESLSVESTDLTPEPGEFSEQTALVRFYERQDRILALGLPTSPRLISDLPTEYWIQIAVGFGALLIAGWIWSLRPRDPGSLLFLLSAAATTAFTYSAAIYSTRPFAIASGQFKTLVGINVLGASAFGIFMILLFLHYPKQLAWKNKLGAAVVFLFGSWTVLSLTQMISPAFGVNFITLVEMIGIVLAIGAQFFGTRGDVRARASLSWLGLAVSFGAGSFILLNALPLILGSELSINQSYAFLSFLLIYLGLAAGLSRYRLFEVGTWAYRMLTIALFSLVLIGIDSALLSYAGLEKTNALSVALVSLLLIAIPFRNVFLSRFFKRELRPSAEILADSLDVAFAVYSEERAARWRQLLQKTFNPLQILSKEEPCEKAELAEDGLILHIPPVMSEGALTLRYPFLGRSLFGQHHLAIAEQLVSLMRKAESSREAYDRGVATERKRMAQDLHDDVGARLLSGLYVADENLKPTFQAALSEIRDIISEVPGERIPLEQLLADLRFETSSRLQGAKIVLDWPMGDEEPLPMFLEHKRHRLLRSAVREVVSNVIRHSQASELKVKVRADAANLDLEIHDNGCGLDDNPKSKGFGLKNIRHRLESSGGSFELKGRPDGLSVFLSMPYEGHVPPH